MPHPHSRLFRSPGVLEAATGKVLVTHIPALLRRPGALISGVEKALEDASSNNLRIEALSPQLTTVLRTTHNSNNFRIEALSPPVYYCTTHFALLK